MIDTIVLRYHGILSQKNSTLDLINSEHGYQSEYAVDEHHELYKKMLKYKNRLFHLVTRVNKETTSHEIMDESEFLQLENGNHKTGFTHIKQIMRFEDAKRVKEVNMRINGSMRSPSSIASVVFSINENGGFIEFNLSIPKYLFSHSLAEFIPQPLSHNYFKLNDPNNIDKQRGMLYARFVKFIEKFNTDLAYMFELEQAPNLDYIELRRIDLCYNQYFDSKKDALNYLNHCFKIAKIKNTRNNNNLSHYDTTLQYNTSSGAYFKIYHKGTEYTDSKHGDFKKHSDLNKAFVEDWVKKNKAIENKIARDLESREFVWDMLDLKAKGEYVPINRDKLADANRCAKLLKKIEPFDTMFFKNEMDKVLRYEISLRGDFFAYHYKRKIFRKDCPKYQELVKTHAYVSNIYNSEKKFDIKVSKADYNDYKVMDKFLKRGIALTFSDNFSLRRYINRSSIDYKKNTDVYDLEGFRYPYTLLSEKDIGIFSKDFLDVCLSHFFDTVRLFRIRKLDNTLQIEEAIRQHNEKVKERVELYNEENHYQTLNDVGKPLIKNKKVITRAVDLLTGAEKSRLRLKTIQSVRLLLVVKMMKQGKSLLQIRDDLKMNKSTFSRLRSDLKMFQIAENSLEIGTTFNAEISFRKHYFNLASYDYQKKFYFKTKHIHYG